MGDELKTNISILASICGDLSLHFYPRNFAAIIESRDILKCDRRFTRGSLQFFVRRVGVRDRGAIEMIHFFPGI